jgi:mono/diheme cytochrome c family protein
MACPRRSSWTLVLLLAPALAAQAAPAGGGADAPALFATNCAKCHGLDGSGTGPAVLDRPARNFKEGGFSFGNTPETIARTIAFGIPGSPMPAFEHAMSDEQRRALAEYVVTLGPPVKEVSEAETLMHVTDRPLVVRGILPPLTEGAHNIPRGLLIGTPDGLTFEYTVDEVRLLAVRQGDFVKRTDWGGRGGTPLEPLGQVVWSEAAPQPPWCDAVAASFADSGDWAEGRPLSARLLATSSEPAASVTYALTSTDVSGAALRPYALVTETPGASQLGEHAGFARHLRLSRIGPLTPGRPEFVTLRLGEWSDALGEPHELAGADGQRRSETYWARATGPDTGEVLRIAIPLPASAPAVTVEPKRGGLGASVNLQRGHDEVVEFELDTFVLSPWTDDILAGLRQQVGP